MKKNRILNRIRQFRAKYIDIFVNYTFDLSGRIQFLLNSKSMDQKDLAKALGKNESEISKWLSGSHNFTLKTIAKIEDVLGDKLLEVPKNSTSVKEKEIFVFLPSEQLYKPTTKKRSEKLKIGLKSYNNAHNYNTLLISANC